jgi:hypothetical protein
MKRLRTLVFAYVAENKIRTSDLIRRDPMINPQETRP